MSSNGSAVRVSTTGSGGLLGSASSLPLGFGMLGGLVPVSLPFHLSPMLNLSQLGTAGSNTATSSSAASNSAAFSTLTQNLYKSLQSGSQVALPPHLQLAFSVRAKEATLRGRLYDPARFLRLSKSRRFLRQRQETWNRSCLTKDVGSSGLHLMESAQRRGLALPPDPTVCLFWTSPTLMHVKVTSTGSKRRSLKVVSPAAPPGWVSLLKASWLRLFDQRSGFIVVAALPCTLTKHRSFLPQPMWRKHEGYRGLCLGKTRYRVGKPCGRCHTYSCVLFLLLRNHSGLKEHTAPALPHLGEGIED
ncbi:hypothetical protein CCH79_00014709 [Gambusia affinis]|uniref:Uncharacterized protein n=1 Tax=Gambusia affinis TaxID=33528 RepID=A0A315UV49_GAMAF|nr:hypothetical protein CCH79_00014709 [Gambusia affinis]